MSSLAAKYSARPNTPSLRKSLSARTLVIANVEQPMMRRYDVPLTNLPPGNYYIAMAFRMRLADGSEASDVSTATFTIRASKE